MSPSAMQIVRDFRAAFAALDDHKSHPERVAIAAAVFAHLRAQYPMTITSLPDPILATGELER